MSVFVEITTDSGQKHQSTMFAIAKADEIAACVHDFMARPMVERVTVIDAKTGRVIYECMSLAVLTKSLMSHAAIRESIAAIGEVTGTKHLERGRKAQALHPMTRLLRLAGRL